MSRRTNARPSRRCWARPSRFVTAWPGFGWTSWTNVCGRAQPLAAWWRCSPCSAGPSRTGSASGARTGTPGARCGRRRGRPWPLPAWPTCPGPPPGSRPPAAPAVSPDSAPTVPRSSSITPWRRSPCYAPGLTGVTAPAGPPDRQRPPDPPDPPGPPDPPDPPGLPGLPGRLCGNRPSGRCGSDAANSPRASPALPTASTTERFSPGWCCAAWPWPPTRTRQQRSGMPPVDGRCGDPPGSSSTRCRRPY